MAMQRTVHDILTHDLAGQQQPNSFMVNDFVATVNIVYFLVFHHIVWTDMTLFLGVAVDFLLVVSS